MIRLFTALSFALLLAACLPALATAAPDTNPGWDRVVEAVNRHDYAEARRIAEELAAKGDPEAINGLAGLVNQGVGGPEDPERARQLFEQAARMGSRAAKMNLARDLASSPDRSQWSRALELLKDAMKDYKLGRAGYYPLGRIILLGAHGQDELAGGVENLRRAVEFEPRNADAQYLVARAYQNGWGGTEKNPVKAFKHFDAAAALGDPRALRERGMARLRGNGVQQDPPAAFADFQAAAEAGNIWATIDVAVMLATGEGVPADPAQARLWYRRAAEQRSAHALRSLGAMLYTGEGGPTDKQTGRAYLELANEAGDPEAAKFARDSFTPITTPERIIVDQIKAEWVRTHGAPQAD